MAKLVLSTEGALVAQCFVEGDRLTVGREPHNRFVIDDARVSREHAAIVTVGNDHILEDLNSANGTYCNGVRITRRILQHGDVVEFGRFTLRYLNPRAADAALERTMFIPTLDLALGAAAESAPLPASRASRTRFPNGRVVHVAGARNGETVQLDRVVAVFGQPGRQSAVVTRRPQGYFLTAVEGRAPRVNGIAIGRQPRLLRDGDRVTVADCELRFAQDPVR